MRALWRIYQAHSIWKRLLGYGTTANRRDVGGGGGGLSKIWRFRLFFFFFFFNHHHHYHYHHSEIKRHYQSVHRRRKTQLGMLLRNFIVRSQHQLPPDGLVQSLSRRRPFGTTLGRDHVESGSRRRCLITSYFTTGPRGLYLPSSELASQPSCRSLRSTADSKEDSSELSPSSPP